MQLDKQTVIDMITKHGDASRVDEAAQQLPDQVDTDEHGGLLERFGLSPQTLISKLGGGSIPGL
jgi:hypothetical protein